MGTVTPINRSRFDVGDVVVHRRFGYRGVVFDVDPVFNGSDEWYEAVAKSRPPKERPWYHVLVHGQAHTTYVAERHLAAECPAAPIEHPLLGELFAAFEDGRYRRGLRVN